MKHLPGGLLGRGVRGAVHVVVNVLDDLRHLRGWGAERLLPGSATPARQEPRTPVPRLGWGLSPAMVYEHRVEGSREDGAESGLETRLQRSERGTGAQRLLRGEGSPAPAVWTGGRVDGRPCGWEAVWTGGRVGRSHLAGT